MHHFADASSFVKIFGTKKYKGGLGRVEVGGEGRGGEKSFKKCIKNLDGSIKTAIIERNCKESIQTCVISAQSEFCALLFAFRLPEMVSYSFETFAWIFIITDPYLTEEQISVNTNADNVYLQKLIPKITAFNLQNQKLKSLRDFPSDLIFGVTKDSDKLQSLQSSLKIEKMKE